MTQKSKNFNISTLAIVLAATLWGLDGVVLTPKLYHLNVPLVVFLEHLVAFLFMLIPLAVEWKEVRKLSKKDWLVFVLLAIFSGALGTMAITKALFYVNYINLSVVVFLQKLQPIFAIILAAILLKEKPVKRFYGLAVFALIGSYLVTFGFSAPNLNVGDKVVLAAAFSVFAAAAFGAGTALSKYGLGKVNYRVGTYLRFGLTTLVMLVILSAFGGWNQLNAVSGPDIVTLLIIALTTGGVAILIYYFGLRNVPASVSSICELAYPFSAVLFEYLLRGSVMSIGQWLGAAVLVVSVYALANKSDGVTVTEVGEFPVAES